MYVKYGNFAFAPHEAGLAVRVERRESPRGFKKYQYIQYDISGELCEVDSDAVTTRLNAIDQAFAFDGGDVGLIHDDGSPSVHYLRSNSITNLTGNRVLYTRLPQTVGAEYATDRKSVV
jgi:hypothetical protein